MFASFQLLRGVHSDDRFHHAPTNLPSSRYAQLQSISVDGLIDAHSSTSGHAHRPYCAALDYGDRQSWYFLHTPVPRISLGHRKRYSIYSWPCFACFLRVLVLCEGVCTFGLHRLAPHAQRCNTTATRPHPQPTAATQMLKLCR